VTVAAYIGRPAQWREWTKQWNVAKRPIKVYHATDCANLEGEFKGWAEDRQISFVKKMLPITTASNMPGVVVGINLNEYRRAMEGRPDLEELFGSPYAACFQWVVQIIMNFAIGAESTESIRFVHETNAHKAEALESFFWVEKMGNPQGTKISLTFGDKDEYTPLQAADILAYEGNKRMRDPSKAERRSWTALDPDKTRIFAAHYGRENMVGLISRLEMIRDRKFDQIDRGTGWRAAAQAIGRGPLVM